MKSCDSHGGNDRISNKIIEKLLQWCCMELKIEAYNYNFVRNFLVGCENDEKKCQLKLNDYFFHKKTHPEYFQAGSFTDEKFRFFCNSVFSLYSPVLTKDGYKIFIDRVTDNEDLFDVGMIMQYFTMQTDLRYLENDPDNGDIILFDCNHVNLLNFVAFLPYFIKSLSLVLKVYPLNLKQLIMINTGRLMAFILNVFKTFLPRRYKRMVHFYADGTDKFLLHVEADVLPSDYGGKLPPLKEMRNDLNEELISNLVWFENINTQIKMTKYIFPCEPTLTDRWEGSFKELYINF